MPEPAPETAAEMRPPDPAEAAVVEQEDPTAVIDDSVPGEALEVELPPVDVIFLYQIIDWVGDLADRAQRVGSRLQLLVAR